jgi:FkbM family methyltransferase
MNIINKSQLLTKLYQIYRVIFPKMKYKPTEEEIFISNLKLFGEVISKNENNYFFRDKKYSIDILIRDFNHSDFDVYRHVFIQEEYKIILELLTLNPFLASFEKKCLMIDAGSNVGYTSIYFSKFIQDIEICTIEPSYSNFEQSRKNFELNKINIYQYNRGLVGQKSQKLALKNNFRDGKDHAFSTEVDLDGDIEGITIGEILEINGWDYITLLKIDIEGAERYVLDDQQNLNYLRKTFIIAVEIHDEYPIRKQIYDVLRNFGFMFFNQGELTIAINKTILN